MRIGSVGMGAGVLVSFSSVEVGGGEFVEGSVEGSDGVEGCVDGLAGSFCSWALPWCCAVSIFSFSALDAKGGRVDVDVDVDVDAYLNCESSSSVTTLSLSAIIRTVIS